MHTSSEATSLSKDPENKIKSMVITKKDSNTTLDVPCSHLLISSGAWSPQVFRTLFPDSSTKIPITSLAGHSLVIHSPRWRQDHEQIGCHAVFTTDEQGYSPEIFSRMGGEIYVAGANSASIPLPESANKTTIDDKVIAQLQQTAKRLMGKPGIEDLDIVRKGLCFRPVTGRGTPILDKIDNELLGNIQATGGVFLAAGHGPWGISMSLGTGKVMSEMMTGKQLSADVRKLRL